MDLARTSVLNPYLKGTLMNTFLCRKLSVILLLLLVLGCGPDSPTASDQAVTPPVPQSRTVFVTRTGEKYHSSSCIHLSSSKIPISIEEAVGSYSACTVCRPETSLNN